MCKKIVFLFLTLFFCQNGLSQKTGKGQVVDYLTNLAIPDSTTTVELLLPDIRPGQMQKSRQCLTFA